MDELIASIRAEVESHGWQVVLLPAEGDAPAYCHTVGLSKTYSHPELVIVGLDDGIADGVMHEVLESAAEFVAGGGRFEVGDTNKELLEGYTLAVRAVSPGSAEALLGFARDVLGGDVPAVQLVWPDRRGLMPWSPACAEDVRARQPLLDSP